MTRSTVGAGLGDGLGDEVALGSGVVSVCCGVCGIDTVGVGGSVLKLQAVSIASRAQSSVVRRMKGIIMILVLLGLPM
jgi:hypothetical protein